MSFDVRQGETVAILGESGSGKSVTAQAIMGILDTPPGFVTGGEIRYCGTDILALSESTRQTRGPEISMVSRCAVLTNPVFPSAGRSRRCSASTGLNKRDSLDRRSADEAGPDSGSPQRVKAFPHQFSGGCGTHLIAWRSRSIRPC